MMGDKYKLFINSGTFGVPDWTGGEVKKARNVKTPRKRASARKDGRGDDVVTYDIARGVDGAISFTLVHKPGDTNEDKFRDAFNNNTPLLVAALDGDPATSGSAGPHGLYGVEDFSDDQPDSGTGVIEVTLLPVDEDQIEYMVVA